MTDKSSVTQSKFHAEIEDLLNSGWSGRRILAYLRHRYPSDPDIPGLRAIERYRDAHVDPVAVLPAKLLTQAMRRLDGAIDEIARFDVAIRVQEQRIALFWKREIETGIADPLFSDALRVYNDYLHRRFQLAAQLGLGRAGKDKRVDISQTRRLQMPEEAFQQMLRNLREVGIEDA